MTRIYNYEIKEDEKLNGFIIGSILGDGCLNQRTINHNFRIIFKHAVDQYQYLNWKFEFLKSYKLEEYKHITKRNFGENKPSTWQDQFYFSTISHPYFYKFSKMKIIELLENMNEMAFSIWMLDDGSINKKVCKLSCARFSPKEKEYVVKTLKNKFDINSRPYENPNNDRKGYIYITSKEYLKVKNLLLSNIPENLDVIYSKFGE